MDNQIKAAIILGAAIIIAVCIWVYFSPYNSCRRDAAQPKPAKRKPYKKQAA
jgi:hypothetical protein